MKSLLSHRWWKRMLVLLLLATLVVVGHPLLNSQAAGLTSNPVVQTWEKARAAGSYAFESDITQLTIPTAKLTNVGRTSRSEQLYLSGQTDLHANRLEMQLLTESGSLLQAQSGTAIKIEDGKSYIRQATGDWQPSDAITLDSYAPQGDFMAFLQAVRNVQAQAPAARGPADQRITFNRYTFEIDSQRLAAALHEQMEAAMHASGELPPTMHLGGSPVLRDMRGNGELWVGADGLPLRQILHLQFPEQRDDRVEVQMVVDFSRFGAPQPTLYNLARAGDLAGIGARLAATLPSGQPFLATLPLLALAALIVYYRKRRLLERALATAVILSLVVGPLLTVGTQARFFDVQRAKAATQKEHQASADADREVREVLSKVEFNPQRNPLEAVVEEPETGDTRHETGDTNRESGDRDVESSRQSPVTNPAAATLAQSTAAVGLPRGAFNWWAGNGNANDLLSTDDKGVLNGSVTFAQGQVGQAFAFNGSNGYVALPGNVFPVPTTAINSVAPFSFELWFKTAASGVILGQQDGTVAPYTATPVGHVPAIYVGTDGRLRVQMFWGGAINPTTSAGAVNNNTFRHLAVVYDGTTQTVYLDGVSIGSRALTQTPYNNLYKYQLGTGFTTNWPGAGAGVGWSNFNGLIDEPTLYQRALTMAEVQSIYTAGSAGKSLAKSDRDGDGLTDLQEMSIGSSAVMTDTDSDGLRDNVEVAGFTLAGQKWYLNPNAVDSNKDGQGDGMEWGLNPDGTLRTAPLDSDGDNTPDLFDEDNDGDGVPDSKDLSPFSKGGFTYTESDPLRIKLNNLTANKPAIVEFQLRPQDPKHLQFAQNVLDWPFDDQGQMQDIDNKTFADVATASGRVPSANEANGDLKLVPMLELGIPTDGANLPTQAELTPYNISVNNQTADGANKTVYVPLTLLTDEKSGQRVAFSGQMRYAPSGLWPNFHSVRLVWVVQALVDQATTQCNAKANPPITTNCTEDGYIHNLQQPIQSYYDNFTLTGLTVREDHGATMDLIYEDPAVDPNKKDDAALWSLAYVLDHHFAIARDDNKDGQRDVTVETIAQRFDRTTNGAVSEADRFGVPNVLRVVKNSYPLLDQALASTAMTETKQLLNSAFTPAVTADPGVKPLIMFAQESSSRLLTLDALTAGGNYVLQTGPLLTLDMAPAGQPAQTVAVVAGLKWAAYCPSAAPITWAPCDANSYWQVLAQRYGANDPDATVAQGRLQWTQLFYSGFQAGSSSVVQDGARISVPAVNLHNAATTTQLVTLAKTSNAAVVFTVSSLVFRTLAVPISVYTSINIKERTIIGSFWSFGSSLYQTIQSNKASTGLSSFAAKMAGIAQTRSLLLRYSLAPLAVGGTVLTIAGSILEYIPQVSKTDRQIVNLVSASLNLALHVVQPSVELGFRIVGGGQGAIQALTALSTIKGFALKLVTVGVVLTVAATFAFFIYGVVASGAGAGSVEVNQLFYNAVASVYVALLLFTLSLNPVGFVITAILAAIDLLLTIICEAGVSALRDLPGAGSGCFTLTGTATKYVAYFLYNYDLMIDVGSPDLIVAGPPQVKPKDATKGLVAGNALAVSMAITSTVKHKNPDPANGLYIYPYLWLYSPDNLRSSTVKLSLTPITQTVQAGWNQMNSRWAVREDHKLLLTPMYRGQVTGQYTLTQPFTPTTGLNQSIPLVLNMGYGVPAYECYAIPNFIIPFVPPVIPICSTREAKGNNSSTLGSLVYDIFPPTLDGFMALSTQPNGSRRLAWDSRFPAVKDADGDSLLAASSGGIDPNDATPDSDNDGLSDLTELQWRQLGQPVSPVLCDSDGDGLSDAQEVQLSSDPTKRDSDGDLIADGDEVWHAVINPTTCQPTGAWLGGWDLTIPGTTPVTVRVSSDPAVADSDGDSIDDLAEKQLGTNSNPAVRVDIQGVTYNPLVPNTPPIQVLTDVSDPDRLVKPGQTFVYTTTMVANVPLAPSVLDVTPATQIGAAPLPKTIVQDVPAATSFTVPTAATTALKLPLTSRVRARLAASAPAWSFDPITLHTLGTFPSPDLARYTSAAASRSDRLDSYRLLTLNQFGPPDINDGNESILVTFALPAGQNRQLATMTTYNPATLACNSRNDCLVIWDETLDPVTPAELAGQLLSSDGTLKRTLTFFVQETGLLLPPGTAIQRHRPVVASNGDGFLVIYEVDPAGIGRTTHIGIQTFSKDGIALSSNVIDTGLRVVDGRTQLHYDLTWFGDRYTLVYKAAPATAIYRVDLNNNGTPLGGRVQLVNNAATARLSDFPLVDYAPRLAYDPVSGRWLLAYIEGETFGVVTSLYANTSATSAVATRTLDFGVKQVHIAYQPQSRSWLATLDDGANNLRAYTLNGADLSDLAAAQRFNSAGNSVPGSTLACPAPSALPLTELRFEEMPGATTFVDSSGRGANVTCTGATCPAAGLPGATTAQNNPVGTPSSDYAIRFDGVDDAFTINRTLSTDFSVALWLKAATGANSTILVDQGANAVTGWALGLVAGKASFLVGQTGVVQSTARFDDNQWHHIVVTRDQPSGVVRLYVDGVAVGTATFTTSLLNSLASIRVGSDYLNNRRYTGQLDNLQLYNTVLGADTVQQLYASAQPAYCVAARANASGTALEWARLNTQAVDNRGGKLAASGGVTVTIDADPPTSTITSLVNNQYLRGSTSAPVVHIVGGSAGDRLSGVANVQVSVNGGAAQLADGANSWLYSLPVTEGQYTIKATAIDGVGNVQATATQPQITLFADGSAPRLIDFIPDSAVLPLRSDRGQPKQPWRLTLYGSAADPTLPGGLPGSGVQSVAVLLTDAASGIDKGWQNADIRALAWSVGYAFPSEQSNPTGIYTVTMQFTDKVGNVSVATRTIRVDVDGPRAVMTKSNVATGVLTNSITSAVTVGGVISDTGSAGLDKAELFITPLTRTLPFSDTLFWLPFDDRAGLNDFTDRTLYQSDGACAICGTVITVDDGKIGQGLYVTDPSSLVPVRGEFDPTLDQYFSNPQQNFSVQAWLKSNDTRTSDQVLFYRQDFQLFLYLQNGRANFRIGSGQITQLAGTSDLRDNQWHHLVGTVNRASGQLSLYVDGQLIDSKPFTQTLSTVSPYRYQIGTGYVGRLDEIVIFGHALNAGEVQALYQAPNPYPVTLAQRGAGVLRSDWTLPLPAGLEGLYQFDLYGRDMQGNSAQESDIWRGLVDTVAPRVALTGRATGQSYLDTATNTQRYEIAYTCRASDFQLYEASFTCAGNSQRPPARSFNNDPLLKQQFPDLTLLTTLVNTYTVWAASPTPTGSLTACDAYNHCTTVNATAATNAVAAAASGTVDSGTVRSAAVTAGPQTAILAPAAGSVVNSAGTVQVSVAAQADQPLKELVILLDNAPASTIAFAQHEGVKRTVQTAAVTVATAGTHTLAVRATDWSGAQSQPIAISFVADRQAPVVALSNSQLTKQDSYGAQTNILRFRGTASDDTGLVAVQVKVGDAAYADATFGEGNWQLAYPVTDPEGKQLAVKVRARDAAGNLTEISQTLGTDLSVADAPDTTLGERPADPSSSTNTSFSFTGSATAVAFECQLDDAPAAPCTSPWPLTDLSNGSHTFKVAALNAQGFADLTPASHTWTVNVTALATTLTAQPEAVTTSRAASFSFTGNGASSFECALDGGKYAACASPKSYDKLGNGNHTFLVRAKAGATNGPATSYAWRVNNAAPTVTGDQVAMVVENGAVNVTLQGIDSDPLTYQIVEQPQHGLLLGLAPNLAYVPNTGYAGPDRFTYRAWDGEAASASATVNITVRLGKYAVFAQEGVAFEQNSAVVRGDVGVNVKSAGPFLRDNVEASFRQNAKMQDPASRVLADSIVVDNNGMIYNPGYNDLTGKGVVNGTRTTPLALPLRSALPALPTITPGTQAVAVSGSQTLAAGSYGAVTVGNGATLVLSGGLYHFASWTVSQNAKVHFQAPSEVRIAGALVVNQNGSVGPAPGVANLDANSIVIHVAGTDGQSGPGNQPRSAAFDQNVVVTAYLVAPNGMINFRQNVNATGAFIGKWVLAEQNAKVTRPGDPVVRVASMESAGGETVVLTPTESIISEGAPTVVVTTSTTLPANTLFLPLVQAGVVGGSEAADSGAESHEPAISETVGVEVAPVLTDTSALTATAVMTATPLLSPTVALTLTTVGTPTVTVPINGADTTAVGTTGYQVFLPSVNR